MIDWVEVAVSPAVEKPGALTASVDPACMPAGLVDEVVGGVGVADVVGIETGAEVGLGDD